MLEEGGANNIFSELTRAEFRDVRQTIVKAILGTDMSSHMQHCADIFQLAQKAKRLRAGEGKKAAAAAAATRSNARQGKGQGRSLCPNKTRSMSEPAVRRQTLGGAGGGWGGRAKMLLAPLPPPPPPPLPPPPVHIIFSADRAEDRSFLAQTIVHWCVNF